MHHLTMVNAELAALNDQEEDLENPVDIENRPCPAGEVSLDRERLVMNRKHNGLFIRHISAKVLLTRLDN